MARRNDIDWESIERDYCAGMLSVSAVAKEHGVSDSQLRARAKKEGWRRDLSEAIKARTKAKIATLDVAELVEESATQSARQSAETIKSAVEKASDAATGVVLRHRTAIKDSADRAKTIETVLDTHMRTVADVREAAALVAAFKAMVDARAKLIAMERQAFGLDDDNRGKQQDITSLEDRLKRYREEAQIENSPNVVPIKDRKTA